MKKLLLLLLIGLYAFSGNAQEPLKNSLSTSLLRLEVNSQTDNQNFNWKFMTDLEYQRIVNKWSFGIRYEHGYNKINDSASFCNDCFYGSGNMREDNVYLLSSYSVLNLFHSRLKFNAGLGIYYSNLNYSGNLSGGLSGEGMSINATYNSFGLAPNISIIYYPIEHLFLSVSATGRQGWGKEFDHQQNRHRNVSVGSLIAPEFKIGLSF